MTTGRGGAEVRLRDIRAHEGSQARAWEELTYQLRPPVGPGHVETRKTRAPDAGVEWYEVYADGHQEGFQAKFHANLADALGGMRESVEAVCAKRPNLTKLTFVVPYDFSDSGSAGTKTDQDRWDDAVAGWVRDYPNAGRIAFTSIRAGEITAKLALKEHAGRREYWFGGLEISDEWLKSRFAESVRVAGDRYTPEADSPSRVNLVIDGALCGPTFVADLCRLAARASAACRQDTGMWGTSRPSASALLEDLDKIREATLCATDDDELLWRVPDVDTLAGVADSLLDLAYKERDNLPNYDSAWRNLDEAISTLEALHAMASGHAAEALTRGQFALIGPAGQGKTHALLRAVDGCLQRDVPALAVLGQRLSDKNWWPAIAETLDGMAVGGDEFLQALDSMAEARRCRALVVVDAINESQAPVRWQNELPAMLAQFQKYSHIALIVSYRSDYRDVVGAPPSLLKVRHPGLTGNEANALEAYCRLFGIPVPAQGLFEPALASPLFLRMYCEVLASTPRGGSVAPTRSNLFERYAEVVGRKVTRKLGLPPTSSTVADALTRLADSILANGGQPVPRVDVEMVIDALLPARTWPDTLFQQLASEGVIELRPTYDGTESVAFPFQAYSEHLLSKRLLASVDAELASWRRRFTPLPSLVKRRRTLAKRIAAIPWSWRSLAVILPEKEGIELVDLLNPMTDDFRLHEATRESLVDRAKPAFGARALGLLQQCLNADPESDGGRGIETVLALAPREAHPGNADWLHAQLVRLTMAERDAAWSIATFQVDQDSDAYRRLKQWSERLADSAGDEDVRLGATALLWLLTSPNRFLRDGASKTLAKLLSGHLEVAASLLTSARQIDDPYVGERVLTCAYGALLVGGDANVSGARSVLGAVSDWRTQGLPVDVIARDSARGIAVWCADRGLLPHASLAAFTPPYGAAPPEEPPTREQLERDHGYVKDAAGNFVEWRASSILMSCLDWYGDFNKYVVKSDVEFFSWHPLSGPAPSAKRSDNRLDEVDVDWAGRWIANRAISLGWTPERFESFERSRNLRRGREGHKAERFGKKYQWIAHRELLARLADNYHPSFETWNPSPHTYEGPWVWYGRDFDPTLPPSALSGESQICRVAEDSTAAWATLASPDMDNDATPDEWVAMTDDLPEAASMFICADPQDRKWVAIQRYSTWDRANAERRGMTKRERDVFFLQFSWLVARGEGAKLYGFIEERGLSGRWMPDTSRTHHQYLGETSTAPIVATSQLGLDDFDIPRKLREIGIRPRPAVEQYLWEGSNLDCSIDESVDFYVPTPELLGSSRWVGHRAEWAVDGRVVARAIECPDGVRTQDVLLVDPEWLAGRLEDLDADLVIGTLSERHALPVDDDDYQHMAFSDVWYVALITPGFDNRQVGPLLRVRRRVDDLPAGIASEDADSSEELFDPKSL